MGDRLWLLNVGGNLDAGDRLGALPGARLIVRVFGYKLGVEQAL
jgi:hypothetical protein